MRISSMKAHQLLGVLPGSTKKELKAAFHRQTWLLHPDRARPDERPAAEKAFKELSEAYRWLSGADMRASWPFGAGRFRKRQPTEYMSMFVEFWGVARREREVTSRHVLRSIFCYRLAPRGRHGILYG